MEPTTIPPAESIQSLGGIARAEKLTKEQRSAIARAAAEARWEKESETDPNRVIYPKATHVGVLKIGKSIEIECGVLEDGTRVLSRAGFVRAIGRTGKVKGGVDYEPESKLPVFLGADNLKPFIDAELSSNSNPIFFKQLKGGISMGYKAALLPAVCNVFLSARDAGVLRGNQAHIAKACEILVRGLAVVGITAMVDEATGYQEVRDRLALQAILDRYLTDEFSKWSRLFEPEFYQHLFRLKGVALQVTPDGRKPQYVGKWTNDIIYSRLAPGIREHLRIVNPRNAAGNKARKDHQHFTRDYGHPALKELLSNVIFLMKTCTTDDEFRRKLDLAAPKMGDTIPLKLDA